MTVSACLNPEGFLEEMCLALEFRKPDFFLPDSCSFSYGGETCVCEVDFDASCYEFNCNGVTPAFLEDSIVSDTCKKATLGHAASLGMFIPALRELPVEVNQENPNLDGVRPESIEEILEEQIAEAAKITGDPIMDYRTSSASAITPLVCLASLSTALFMMF